MLTRNLKLKFTQIDDAPFVDVVDVALEENLTKKEHGLTTTRTHARRAAAATGTASLEDRREREGEGERKTHTHFLPAFPSKEANGRSFFQTFETRRHFVTMLTYVTFGCVELSLLRCGPRVR